MPRTIIQPYMRLRRQPDLVDSRRFSDERLQLLHAECSPACMRRTLCPLFLWVVVGVMLITPIARSATIELSGLFRTSFLSPAIASYKITGTGDRNNPLRLPLAKPFDSAQLFMRFRINYDAASIDSQPEDNGEFFVLWLDTVEGADESTHSGGIPNVGIHVNKGTNAFMVRYQSGSESFSNKKFEGGHEYLIVCRLWKTKPGAESPFDALDLWVDPATTDEFKPQASRTHPRSIKVVRWIGISTGRKTESEDKVTVSDIALADSWTSILGLEEEVPVAPYEPDPEPVVVRTVDFRKDIHPILKEHCFECHAGGDPKGEVRLDVLDEALNQTAPRDASASRLVYLVESTNLDERMPPKKRDALSEAEIGKLRAWIDEGFDWDEELLPTPAPKTDHWSFQHIERPKVPKVGNKSWVATPVDSFIARGLESKGLQPAEPADRNTLVRRIAFDLIGLPAATLPPAAEDSIADYAERLMQSKLHGERWGRHWLDVARWAESNGHQHNRDRPHAWRYRDYVIQSLAKNKPFDVFLREQIAGDELPFNTEAIVATGFLAAARYSGNELDKDIQRNDILVDQVNTTSSAFLGLTMECAQCHTHKFDPITIRDYYRLQSFFRNGQPGNVILESDTPGIRNLISRRWAIFDNEHTRLVKLRRKRGYPEPILVQPKTVINGLNGARRKQFQAMEASIAKLPQSWSFYSATNARSQHNVAPHVMRWPLARHAVSLARQKTHLLVRGDVKSRGPEVKPGIPSVFKWNASSTSRLNLADWLTSRENPLTARVWVNRIWQWHFGRGLVETTGDFGKQGTKPSHPELLDWLAVELMENNWDTRHIHRLILGSNTYRQSSAYIANNAQLDPDNLRYWRWEPRRLEAEAIRDTMLATAGSIDLKAGGASVPRSKVNESNRRSVYLQQKRDNLPHQQMLFDGANAVTSCAHRRVSTVSLQPLYLLNSKFAQRMAREFAKSVEEVHEPRKQVAEAIQRALGRKAEIDELRRGELLTKEHGLVSFCAALMNLNEFLYIP